MNSNDHNAKDDSAAILTGAGVGHGSAILPDRPGLVAEYWQGAQEKKLLLQRCCRCSNCWHPLSDVCGACQSFDVEWFPSTGTGSLYSYTVVHHAVHPIVQGWVPYTLCLIELDEGPRILSTLEPESGQEPAIGTRAHLEFRSIHSGFQLPVFRLLPNRKDNP
ncbi:Zn-ribbon domain-containing OB-fold protein [Pollutimonas thiosulfatoxidans]|uniref:ChsH2 C-terminal OB-fold domain-containing protein n=1 Tax=Pollutimonas thiosulfatoxidans TaxID=2028345 RepID=A0A410GE99_9BURK|nr:OB-fold domain-containing protein [Pollutimonas thiosulfatoxidans]NYT44283.1 OB-fold domain-containing protein [Alcaligenaceae bacterium]QAA94620.1 hypothetical protein CKA81_12835 [Pollutimonas thiosulfatoxidans]